MDGTAWALALTVAVPFIGTGAILALRGRPDAREAASLVTSILTFLLAASALPVPLCVGGVEDASPFHPPRFH